MKITLKERSPNHWRLRLETGKDEAGNRVFKYETVTGSCKDAERRRFEILHGHETGAFAVPSKITLAAFFRRWIETRLALSKITRSTAENYRQMFDVYVAPKLGGKKLQAISGPDVQQIYVAMASGTGQNRAKKLSENTLRHMHRIMAALFHAARRSRLIKVNVMEEVEPPNIVRSKPKAITGDDAVRLVETLAGDWKEPIVILALSAGLRRGEVLGLRWKDVDLNSGKLSVNGQLVEYQDHSVQWKAPKTAAGTRTISLPSAAVDLLHRIRRQAAETRLRLGVGGGGLDDAYVFTADGETPHKPSRLSRSFSAHCDAHGLPEFTFHGTRHTHLTELLRRVGKAGAKAVSERAGHADLTTTLKIYQTVFVGDDENLAELSAGLIGSARRE
jgi:integrase